MDHYTPLALRTHTSDAVPTLLYDSREKKPGCGRSFSERECVANEQKNITAMEHGFQLLDRLLEKEK